MTTLAPLILVAALIAAPVTAGTAADGPLDDSREVAQRVDFTGTVALRWWEDGRPRVAMVDVSARDGVVRIEGANDAVARGTERFVRHGGSWSVLWPAGLGGGAPPAMATKYRTSATPGPAIAGRATKLIEVSDATQVRERLAVDVETGLLLEREQLDADGRVARRMVFERLELQPRRLPAAQPRVTVRPDVRSAAALPAPYLAPRRLAGGFERVGVYRRADAVHVLYSDGLYALSVFEQPGQLRRGQLPLGETVRMGRRTVRLYGWAGGHVVMWQTRDTTWTAVGDAPFDQLRLAVDSLPGARPLSTAQRVVRRCRMLVEAISGRP